jgi:hypothetical protein
MQFDPHRRRFHRLTAAALAAPWCLATRTAHALDERKVRSAMEYLKAATEKLGKPRLEGDDLFFGTVRVNGDSAVVDGVKDKFGGVATLFVKKGPGFTRISTSVVRDGKRAVGTPLDPMGPVMAAMRQGVPYYGIVDILGRMFETGYEPILSGKDVVGIYFVGFPLE